MENLSSLSYSFASIFDVLVHVKKGKYFDNCSNIPFSWEIPSSARITWNVKWTRGIWIRSRAIRFQFVGKISFLKPYVLPTSQNRVGSSRLIRLLANGIVGNFLPLGWERKAFSFGSSPFLDSCSLRSELDLRSQSEKWLSHYFCAPMISPPFYHKPLMFRRTDRNSKSSRLELGSCLVLQLIGSKITPFV